MADITITFRSATQLPSGSKSFIFEVDEIYAPDFKAAVAAHPVYGKVYEQIMADTGAVDADGKPVLGPATQVREATFEEGLEAWANANIRDVVLGAVNDFRLRKAQAIALAQVSVEPITTIG